MKKNILFIPLLILLLTSFTKVNNSSSYIVMESTTKTILKSNNKDEQMLIASTAKILTAMTVIENYDLDEKIYIKEEYTKAIGSSVYLRCGNYFSRRELLHALMLRSANDAACALSDNDSDSFIIKMNELAKKIGMKNSFFTNASGLDEKEYNMSTAYDLALLAAYASNNQIFVEISSKRNYRVTTDNNCYVWLNKHKLVNNNDDFIWGKTGYTKKAHRILVSNYRHDNMDIIVVTINNNNDWNFHKEAVNSLDNYSFVTIYNKGIHEIILDKEYYLLVDNSITIPVLNDEIDSLKLSLCIFENKAILCIHFGDIIIYQKNVMVFDKNNIDIDHLIELYM